MTDRLAAARARQGGGGGYQRNESYESGGDYGNNGGQAGGGGGGNYQSRRANPYARQDDNANRFEMTAVSNNNVSNGYNNDYGGGYSAPAPAAGGDMNAFWDEVRDVQNQLRTFNDNVTRISDLHSRSLNNMGDQGVTSQIDDLVAENRQMSSQLKNRIKALQSQGGDSRDGQTRRQQAGLLKTRFQEAIQSYQQVEQQHRNAQKQRMERQYRIVNPNATPEEVRAVVNNEGGGQIFQQALMDTRVQGSRAAYREVQERHQDLQRIEQTIAELAQLFNDMAILVEEQGEVIKHVEATTQNVTVDTEAALVHTEEAKKSAMSARKKRWICFVIVLIIVIIIVVVILFQVVKIGGGGGGKSEPATVTNTVTSPAASTSAPPVRAIATRLR